MKRFRLLLLVLSISLLSLSPALADCHVCDQQLIPGQFMCRSVTSTERSNYGSCVSPGPEDDYCTNLSDPPPPPTCNDTKGRKKDPENPPLGDGGEEDPCVGGILGCPAECASC